MKRTSSVLVLALLPLTAMAGGTDAEALEGSWVGSLITAEAETAGAVALVLEQDSKRRASGPLALGLPGFDGVEFGELDLTISGSGVVSGVAHSTLIAYDDVEVNAQLVIHGEYVEDTGAIIADATLHLAGMGGETLTQADYQKYFSGHDMGEYFGGRDLGEFFGGRDLGGSLGGTLLDRGDMFNVLDVLDLGAGFSGHDLGEFIISTSIGAYFGGHDMGEYLGAESFSGHDLGEFFGAESFSGHDLGEFFGGHDMGEYFEPELFSGHDLGEFFSGHDLGEYLTGSFLKRFGASVPPSTQLTNGGAVSFVLVLVPAAD